MRVRVAQLQQTRDEERHINQAPLFLHKFYLSPHNTYSSEPLNNGLSQVSGQKVYSETFSPGFKAREKLFSPTAFVIFLCAEGKRGAVRMNTEARTKPADRIARAVNLGSKLPKNFYFSPRCMTVGLQHANLVRCASLSRLRVHVYMLRGRWLQTTPRDNGPKIGGGK